MAEISFRLSQREADALSQDWPRGIRKSQARRSAEFKMRSAIFTAFPSLRQIDKRRAEDAAHFEAGLRIQRRRLGL